MNTQLNIFEGERLRDKGITQAVTHADYQNEKWSENAYTFLLRYIRNNKEFMTEDARNASLGIIPEPPSARAWGGIIVKAAKNGLIERIGYRNVKNSKAHCTPAAVWRVK